METREASPEDRSALARMVTKAFANWRLETSEALGMLGLFEDDVNLLTRYCEGEPLSDHRDQLDRAGHILAIHKTLRMMFPHDREQAYRWMRTRNRAFEGRTPAEVVADEGFQGLLRVRAYLDRAAAH